MDPPLQLGQLVYSSLRLTEIITAQATLLSQEDEFNSDNIFSLSNLQLDHLDD